ncbi:MAG: phosphoglycerate mutase family protein [Lachnospiraceae bacterium]|nr:phosphoglycerate mutase family protein [Lachnospiraceae bacterium]
MIRIIMVRHFATYGNVQKRYVGRTDEPVIENRERENMISDPKKISALKEVKAVYCSPMLRCLQTAEFLFPEMELEKVSDFRECDFGAFEYKNYEELKDEPSYQKWMDSNGKLPFPGGESREQFQKRCREAFDQVRMQALEENLDTIALVIHGGTIMSILDAYSDPHKDYYAWQTGNGNGYVMESKDNGRLGHICMLR